MVEHNLLSGRFESAEGGVSTCELPDHRPADRERPNLDAAPANYTAQVFHSVDEIDIAAWEQVRAADDLFMDLRLLRIIESALAGDAHFHYALIRDALGQPVAAACLCACSVDATVLTEDRRLRRLIAALGKIVPALTHPRILFCGMPLSAGQSHLRFVPGIDHRAVLGVLDALLAKIAREERALCIVLKEFGLNELPPLESLKLLGYRRADSLPVSQAGSEHRSFGDYLASLNHKKRLNIRNSQKKLASGGVKILTTSDSALVDRIFGDDVHRLYQNVIDKSETIMERLPASFFRDLARRLPENCVFQFAMQEEKVLAFAVSLFSNSTFYGLYMGIDYDANVKYDLYFNMLYASFSEGLCRGVSGMEFGQTADQVKRQKLGSHQTPRYFVIKGAGFAMRRILGLFSKHLFPARSISAPAASD